MHFHFLRPLQTRRVILGIVLAFVSAGCGMMPLGHRSRPPGKACLGESYGVEDPVFHGHTKTHWRTWNQEAWSASDGAVNYVAPPIPADPASPVTGSSLAD